MTPLTVVLGVALVAAVIGACLLVRVLLAQHEQAMKVSLLREERLTAQLVESNARLVLAWKDGYVVPPPAIDAPEPVPPLDPMVDEWIQQWDGPEAQEVWRRIAREYQTAGRAPGAILHELERRLGRDES